MYFGLRTPDKDRNWPYINANIERCNKHFSLLNNILKNKEYLCGDFISLADIAVGTTLYRYFELDIEKPIMPYVEKWYKGLSARIAYQQNVMIPFNDMKGRLSF